MFKAMAYIGGAAFLIGICCSSIVWAACLVTVGGSLAAIGCYGMEDENEYFC